MLSPRLSALWRPLPLLLSLLLALPVPVRAVFPDEVGHIDYHHELVGLPQPGTTFFHRPRRDDKASLLYTLSDVGVLAAVNPATGAILWRHLLADPAATTATTAITSTSNSAASHNAAAAGFLRAGEGESWLVSALRSSVHAWDAVTGRNRWWMDFAGEVRDLEIMEMTEKNERKDALVLAEEEAGAGAASTVLLRRLNGDDGSVVWEFRETTKDIPLQVSTNVEKVFVVSLHGTTAPYSLKVSSVDTLTGRRLDELMVGTKGGDVPSASHVMFVGANSAAPIVAWTDQDRSVLYINVLGIKTRQAFPLEPGTVAVEIHAPHLVQSQPHFLVHSRTKTGNRAEVYHIDLKNNAITKAYDLPHLAGPGSFSVSSSEANVYFTRVTEDEVILLSSASHGILGRWPLEKRANKESQVNALQAVTEVVKKSASKDSYAVRSAVVTDADEWVMIREGKVAWDRPEGMTGVVAASFADIPGSGDLARELEQEAHSNPWEAYVHRWKRHINDLQYLPEYLNSIPPRLLDSITGSDSSSISKAGKPSRDSFGFHKLVILATKRGRLYGLDTGNHGQILWSQKAFDVPKGKRWNVKGMHVQDAKGQATIRGADGEYVVVKTDTGKVVESMPPKSWPPVESTVLVDSPQGQWLMTVGPGGKIGSIPSAWTPKQNLVVRTPEGGLRGVGFVDDGSQSHEVTLWTFSLPAGQRIASIATRPTHDVVASIGRVLGDRRVLYKYLNPNTLVVAAADDAASTLTVYLLDTISGEVLHSAAHTGVDTRDPAHKPAGCVMAENWFLCAFFDDHAGLRANPAQSLKGFQLVVTDLYESAEPNDRGPLGDSAAAANMSSLAPLDNPAAAATTATTGLLPHAVSQAYVLSAPVSALQVSQTRQGIATRMVLAYLPTLHGVAGLPRALLEPRRPVGRDATPAEAEAEGLIRYAPAIELDPKMVVSHRRDVLGVRALTAAPAVVESTGLVLAWGDVDVFGTRVAPSFAFDILGKGFNKITLVGTVLALGAGVVVMGPLVRRKQINLRWTAPL